MAEKPSSSTSRRSQPRGHAKVAKVMHEYKEGTLKSASGKRVTDRDQAVAIGLSEQRRAEGKRDRRPRAKSASQPQRKVRR